MMRTGTYGPPIMARDLREVGYIGADVCHEGAMESGSFSAGMPRKSWGKAPGAAV